MNALLAIALLCSAIEFASSEDAVVKTPYGTIVGSRVAFQGREVDQYLGVPYALPPLGDLRFRKPVPLSSSSGTITAKKMRAGCEQFSHIPYPWNFEGERSEDCLYLNVWVPVSPPRNKTVMYWMHGGGYMLGSIAQPLYDGRALAAFGDVIVVTVNYRLHALGFLYSGSDDAPGNMGLYDQLEGLKWVNRNIQAFGGDPKSITIFGESVGGFTVSFFTVSPLTRGLYKRVIIESGTSVLPPFDGGNDADLKYTQQLAKNLSCADDTRTIHSDPAGIVKCLKKVDARKIAEAASYIIPNNPMIFVPRHGDELLPESPRILANRRRFHDSELLIGVTQDEGSFFLPTTYPGIFGFFGEKNTTINYTTAANLADELFERNGLKDSYPLLKNQLDYNLQVDLRRQVYGLIGDAMLVCPTAFFAELFAKNGNNVYFYVFAHRPSTTVYAPWLGVPHYEELQFVFGNPFLYPRNYTEAERTLSKFMMGIWSNFAKTGKPGTIWPMFTSKMPILRVLNLSSPVQPTVAIGISRSSCKKLRSTYTSSVLKN